MRSGVECLIGELNKNFKRKRWWKFKLLYLYIKENTMSKEMREQINKVKNWNQSLNENTYSDFEKLEMIAASVSTKIGDSILKQGFNRTSKSRTDNRFINQYLNGVDTLITTQVDFSNDINVFFKIQLEGSRKTNSTQQDINRVNSEYTRFFDQIMTDIENGKNNGDFNHLNIDFNLEYFIDKL
jgi:hypothetical protein